MDELIVRSATLPCWSPGILDMNEWTWGGPTGGRGLPSVSPWPGRCRIVCMHPVCRLPVCLSVGLVIKNLAPGGLSPPRWLCGASPMGWRETLPEAGR